MTLMQQSCISVLRYRCLDNKQDDVYGVVTMARPFPEFTRFIWWLKSIQWQLMNLDQLLQFVYCSNDNLHNLGGTWKRICSPDIRNVSALEVLSSALYKSTFTYLLTRDLFHCNWICRLMFAASCQIWVLKTFRVSELTIKGRWS